MDINGKSLAFCRRAFFIGKKIGSSVINVAFSPPLIIREASVAQAETRRSVSEDGWLGSNAGGFKKEYSLFIV